MPQYGSTKRRRLEDSRENKVPWVVHEAGMWGFLVCALEWCVFVCNHSSRGERWKESFSSSPALIQAIMANGLYTPLGVWVVSGLHCLPLWLYSYQWGLLTLWLDLPLWIQAAGTLLLQAVTHPTAANARLWNIKFVISREQLL